MKEKVKQYVIYSRKSKFTGKGESIENHDVIYKGWITPPKITS